MCLQKQKVWTRSSDDEMEIQVWRRRVVPSSSTESRLVVNGSVYHKLQSCEGPWVRTIAKFGCDGPQCIGPRFPAETFVHCRWTASQNTENGENFAHSIGHLIQKAYSFIWGEGFAPSEPGQGQCSRPPLEARARSAFTVRALANFDRSMPLTSFVLCCRLQCRCFCTFFSN